MRFTFLLLIICILLYSIAAVFAQFGYNRSAVVSAVVALLLTGVYVWRMA